MCGILFQYDECGCDRASFETARDLMAHRGPDAVGAVFLRNNTVALGHRRLSVIDLSKAANQPMRRGHHWIVYNGEVYNFREIREELERKGYAFETRSDTEVLLAGYVEWGAGLCDRLVGMFAFVIWDDVRQTAFCARDPVGQKPLYYYAGKNSFAVASELPALRKLVRDPLSIRWEGVPEILYYGYIPEPYTWQAEIRALLPGHYMEVSFGGSSPSVRVVEYWTFQPDPDPAPVTEKQALDLIGAEIEKAVRLHLIADVEVGVFLSGGVDSSCIASVAAKQSARRVKTFCMGMGDEQTNEAPQARQTAERLGTEHHEEHVPSSQFRAPSQEALSLFGQPFADYSFVPTRQLAKIARRLVKCVLTGDGGDEVWGGYAHYPKHVRFPPMDWSSPRGLFRSLVLRARGLHAWQQKLNIGHVMVTPQQVNACLSDDFLKRLGDYDVTWYVRKYWDPKLDPFRRAQWADIKTYLVSDILVKVDRCAMRESLETRPPFLCHRLIETVLNLPTDIKNPRGELKGLLKRWLRGRVPDVVLDSRKRGFGLPPAQFPRTDATTFALPHCVEAGLVDAKIVPRIAAFAYASWKFELIEAALSRN